MTTAFRLAIVACAFAVVGCQHTDSIVKDLPARSSQQPGVTKAVANLSSVNNQLPVGRILLDREELVVALDSPLRNLPPNSNLTLTLHPYRGDTAAAVGPVTDLRGTSDSGILAIVNVDNRGLGTLTSTTTVVYFLYDGIIGRNLVLTDEDRQVVATGILGIAGEN